MKVWITAARPKTLWAAIAPVLIGSAMAFEEGGFHLYSALAALFGAVMIQIGTNFANDYFDFKQGVDQPDRLGPVRVTQAGMVKPQTMKAATAIVFGLAFLAGIYLVYRGGLPIVAIGLSSILFGILYTAGPVPIGYVGLGDIFVLIFFGPVAVAGTYYVQTLEMTPEVLSAGLAPGLFSVAILTINNLRDIDSDRASGKKTLAVRFGETFSKGEYLFSIVVAALIPFGLYLLTGRHAAAVICALVIPAALPAIKQAFTRKGVVLNDVLASTGKLLLLYSVLFAIGWNL